MRLILRTKTCWYHKHWFLLLRLSKSRWKTLKNLQLFNYPISLTRSMTTVFSEMLWRTPWLMSRANTVRRLLLFDGRWLSSSESVKTNICWRKEVCIMWELVVNQMWSPAQWQSDAKNYLICENLGYPYCFDRFMASHLVQVMGPLSHSLSLSGWKCRCCFYKLAVDVFFPLSIWSKGAWMSKVMDVFK